MKSRMKLIVLFSFLSFLANCTVKKITVDCSEPIESVDPEFCAMVNNAMLSFQVEDSLTIYSRTNSMIILEAVTGIRSRANGLHHPFYKSSRLLNDDLKKWSKWFENSKHNWTKSKADSIVLIFSGEN